MSSYKIENFDTLMGQESTEPTLTKLLNALVAVITSSGNALINHTNAPTYALGWIILYAGLDLEARKKALEKLLQEFSNNTNLPACKEFLAFYPNSDHLDFDLIESVKGVTWDEVFKDLENKGLKIEVSFKTLHDFEVFNRNIKNNNVKSLEAGLTNSGLVYIDTNQVQPILIKHSIKKQYNHPLWNANPSKGVISGYAITQPGADPTFEIYTLDTQSNTLQKQPNSKLKEYSKLLGNSLDDKANTDNLLISMCSNGSSCLTFNYNTEQTFDIFQCFSTQQTHVFLQDKVDVKVCPEGENFEVRARLPGVKLPAVSVYLEETNVGLNNNNPTQKTLKDKNVLFFRHEGRWFTPYRIDNTIANSMRIACSKLPKLEAAQPAFPVPSAPPARQVQQAQQAQQARQARQARQAQPPKFSDILYLGGAMMSLLGTGSFVVIAGLAIASIISASLAFHLLAIPVVLCLSGLSMFSCGSSAGEQSLKRMLIS